MRKGLVNLRFKNLFIIVDVLLGGGFNVVITKLAPMNTNIN